MSRSVDVTTDSDSPAAADPVGNEALLASLLNSISDFTFMKDPQGRYRMVNAAVAEFLGRPMAEILGRDDFALFPAEQAQKMVEQDRAVLASGSTLTFEEEVTGHSKVLFLQTVKSVCRDATGAVIGLTGISRDISERRELEQKLRRREHELSEAQRVAGIGTWRWDRDIDTVTWSDEIYRIFGVTREQKRPESYAELLRMHGPESQQRVVRAFDRAVRLGEPYCLDMEFPRPDGSTAWVITRCEVEAWKDGRVASLRGTVLDITERKLREQQLAQSENRYRSLVHASSQIVWVCDAAGRPTNAVPVWQEITGQSREQILGIGWVEAIHPEDRAEVLRHWEECVATGRPYRAEQRVRSRDGSYRHMLAHAVPARDAAGRIVEWVGTHTDITEQKQAQEQLDRAHQRLENVINSITDGLCVLDQDLRYIYFSENGARMSGRRPEEIVGKRLGDLFPENKTNAFARCYRRALETGETVHFEEFYGEPLNEWVECNCYPSRDGLTVYFRYITERKRTEAALRASEARYRKLFESNLMGICRPDRFGLFREGNDELLRITGYSREELDAGLVRWDTMTPPEYTELDAAHIAEAAERGSCSPYEKEYIRKDGTRVPILCGYALLEGSTDEYIGFVFDLSRQRAAEEALREREQRFRQLAESLPELVWVNDAAGRITYLNQRFLDYRGEEGGALGFSWQRSLHPDETDRVAETWQTSLRTGQPYFCELRMCRHDGAFRYFLARALPVRSEAGVIEHWVGSCTDIHDQKLAEEALRRTEKLAATGRLAASIAHEINNPLSAVTNALYLALLDPEISQETRAFLKTAEEELARVSHITTQTLRFHRQSKAAAYADLSETMHSVLMLFAPRFRSRQIEIQAECAPGARICCFEDELRQVFANLVSNALDATADCGRLRIRVRAVTSAKGEPGVRVTVADTGCGIPPTIRERIFEPFFSTKDTTGIGLGLWVSDGVIRKHAGRLSLRSSTAAERHGTAFAIFFPQNGIA